MKIKGSKNNIIVEGELIFDNAQQVKDALLARLEKITQEKEVNIDLSGLTDIDSSGIQLLIALIKSMQRDKIKYKIIGANTETKEILDLSGLNKFLKLEN